MISTLQVNENFQMRMENDIFVSIERHLWIF